MSEKKVEKRFGMLKNPAGRIAVNVLVTLIFGFGYFYLYLPAINLQDSAFYTFIFILCIVYMVCALITSGTELVRGEPATYLAFVKKQCLPVGLLMVLLLVVSIVGSIISMPIFRAGSYQALLTVESGDFSTDVAETSFDDIPLLDEESAIRLGTTQMGTLTDMVSQFEVSEDYTQINYQGQPVRVAPLEYADLFKWFTNRTEGLPAYIMVDMVTQEVEVVRLDEDSTIKYSPSEPLNRNIERHLRFSYPTYMFSDPSFEVDDEGTAWWVCPRLVKTIGLFGGTDVQGAVLVNATTGESTYYEEVPNWVDQVYPAELIVEQYDYYGTLVNGFINSIFGQRDVTVTTDDYNYIALDGDVYMYTGVTSVSSDQSNLGFLLSNQRTKETSFYTAPGATEYAAQVSAEGAVQDLGYDATFPLLLNVAGEPTYFMALKDASQLVKQYAMVNVSQYSTIISTATTVAECESQYLALLLDRGITTEVELPQTTAEGKITEIREAVIEGNTYYFVLLAGEETYYSISAADNALAVILDVGDEVIITHAPQDDDDITSILDGYTIALK